MNKTYLFVIIVITISSCRVPYDPDIEGDQEILVVDAFLTNHTGASYVKLSTAIPYDSAKYCPRVQNATVSLIDENHNSIPFSETSAGYYEPGATFAGQINLAYKLNVIMPNGDIYVSQMETIPEEMEPVSVYGGYDQVEYLSEDAYGKTVKITEDVSVLYFDYIGETAAPHFRYNSTQLIEYGIPTERGSYYCWRTVTDNSLRFTNEKYTSSSVNVYKQEVSLSPASGRMLVDAIYADSMIVVNEHKRIVIVNQYRLNDDSYAYYKKIKAQSDAEGKLFDPVISQISGNISCVNASKPVVGFFEASNLKTMSYAMSRNGLGSFITITRVNNLPPHPLSGYIFNQKPDFWVQ
jgi:hypothetical protein